MSYICKVIDRVTHRVNYKVNKFLTIPNSTSMYLSNERAVSYPVPAHPDFTGIRKKAARTGRKLLTACLGREFMGLSARHKVYGLYFIVSLMAPIMLYSESHPWLTIPLVVNLGNAVRLANRIVRETSARD